MAMTRRKFIREFKVEAVRLMTDRGVAVTLTFMARISPVDKAREIRAPFGLYAARQNLSLWMGRKLWPVSDRGIGRKSTDATILVSMLVAVRAKKVKLSKNKCLRYIVAEETGLRSNLLWQRLTIPARRL